VKRLQDELALKKAATIGEMCNEHKYRLAVAESMTAGLLSDLICSVSGASNYFRGGLVCYQPDVKSLVGVTEDAIEEFGIYSKEVAAGLATGAMAYFKADLAAGITGIAEPDDENPVPGAWVAVAFIGKVVTRHVLCDQGVGRNQARRHVAEEALDLLVEVLETGQG
jgi:PncC family amidohydrolase